MYQSAHVMEATTKLSKTSEENVQEEMAAVMVKSDGADEKSEMGKLIV